MVSTVLRLTCGSKLEPYHNLDAMMHYPLRPPQQQHLHPLAVCPMDQLLREEPFCVETTVTDDGRDDGVVFYVVDDDEYYDGDEFWMISLLLVLVLFVGVWRMRRKNNRL